MAKCLGCGCTTERACAGGCHWLAVDDHNGVGVCSCCPITLMKIEARGPDPLAPPLEPKALHISCHDPFGKSGANGERLYVLKSNKLVAIAERKAAGAFEIRITLGDGRQAFGATAREELLQLDLTTLVANKIKELGA